VKGHESGERIQGALYLLALEKQKGLKPAGLIFYGLRQEPYQAGWLVRGLAAPEDLAGEAHVNEIEAADLVTLIDGAAGGALHVVEEIRSGRIGVSPKDRQVCRRQCAYRQLCRVEV
jgi:hypothetical protein